MISLSYLNGSKAMEWLLTPKIPANVPWVEQEKRVRLNIEENKLPTADHVKLLGVEIDSKLTFNKHIEKLCSKICKKVTAFATLNNFISREQAFTVCNAVILSNFNHCPFIWLFCNKGADKEIDRALRILFKDYELSFKTLLAHNGCNNSRIGNLQS